MGPLRPGLRREPATDRSSVGEDADLAARIRAEIAAAGPMPFARFMDLALYDPAGGYYRGATPGPGRDGDFLTAPELHPIFGQLLARAIAEIWERLDRPDPFVIREYGAGTGALAGSILGGARDLPLRDAVRYQPVEVDPRRLVALRDTLAADGLGDRLDLDKATDIAPDAPFVGVVLANEVLDALPVHRVRRRGDHLFELAVGLDPHGALVETEIEPSVPALDDRLRSEGINLVDGQTAEICLALDQWIATATAYLTRGAVLLIDYGAPATELYDPVRRRAGTLRAYVRHQVHDDPYRHIGRQDLTAHVDLTAVERAAAAAGLTTIGITTQAEALMGLGVEAHLQAIQADPATTLEAYTLLRSSLMRLLDPAAMGRFRVMAFGRDWPAAGGPLSAFAYRLPDRSTPAASGIRPVPPPDHLDPHRTAPQ
ncbi:MAG: SAM-dependent methyltransferase [Chloroflexi bacterium]|nr:SAM-dependent methyltransferase [Chloroflexota bacterium]